MVAQINKDIKKRLTILAGEGILPKQLAKFALEIGYQIQILSFNEKINLGEYNFELVKLKNPLDIILKIRSFKTTHICMVGALKVSDENRVGILKFFKMKKNKSVGDTNLSKVGKALEISTGAKLLGVHEIMPQILAKQGLIAGKKLNKSHQKDGLFALNSAHKAGELDLGQALICSGERIISLEDIAGTDELIHRVGKYKKSGLVGGTKELLILAKVKKKNQPAYVDLPAIGPKTIITAKNAGLDAIFVQAKNSILIDEDKLKKLAEKHEISVYGVNLNEE